MQTYTTDERCTAKVAADILNCSLGSGQRYVRNLRKAKGYNAYAFVSVGEFVAMYPSRCGYFASRIRLQPSARFVERRDV